MEVKLTPVEFLKAHVPPLGYYRKIVNKALEMEREQIADLQSRLDLAVKALEKIATSPKPTSASELNDWEEVVRQFAVSTLTKLKGE